MTFENSENAKSNFLHAYTLQATPKKNGRFLGFLNPKMCEKNNKNHLSILLKLILTLKKCHGRTNLWVFSVKNGSQLLGCIFCYL